MLKILLHLSLIITLLNYKFSLAESTDNNEIIQLKREVEQQCDAHYKEILKPLRERVEKLNDDLEICKLKDEENLVQQKSHEKIIKQLTSQINIQLDLVQKMSDEFEKIQSKHNEKEDIKENLVQQTIIKELGSQMDIQKSLVQKMSFALQESKVKDKEVQNYNLNKEEMQKENIQELKSEMDIPQRTTDNYDQLKNDIIDHLFILFFILLLSSCAVSSQGGFFCIFSIDFTTKIKKISNISKIGGEFCDVIDSYGGRDLVMKVSCYSLKFMAGYHSKLNPDLAKRFAIASSQIFGARATLRLIDDIPVIQNALEYKLGKDEPDRIMALLGVTANIVDFVYYSIEKVCWISVHKIVEVNNADNWDNANSIFWMLSIYWSLMRTLRNLWLNRNEFNRIHQLENPTNTDLKFLAIHRLELISVIRNCLDIVDSISYLPKGYLWGGELSAVQVGLIGALSASLGIYQIFLKKRLNK